MTDDDIKRIESGLQIVLPPDYKEAVRNYPVRFCQGTDDAFLFDNSEAVIELNRRYRAGFAGLPSWPPHFFFIGDDGAANCYFIDLTKTPSPVFFADHGNIQRVNTEAATIPDWIGRVLDGFRADGIDPTAEQRPRNWLAKLLGR